MPYARFFVNLKILNPGSIPGLLEPNPCDHATERVAAYSHAMVTLIATDCDKAASASSCVDGHMMPHDCKIAGSRNANANTHMERVNGP